MATPKRTSKMRAGFLIPDRKLPFDGARLQENRSLVAFVFLSKYLVWAASRKNDFTRPRFHRWQFSMRMAGDSLMKERHAFETTLSQLEGRPLCRPKSRDGTEPVPPTLSRPRLPQCISRNPTNENLTLSLHRNGIWILRRNLESEPLVESHGGTVGPNTKRNF